MPLLADLQQLRLGDADHLERGFALVGGARDGRRADGHEPAQQALVLDDPDVFLNDRPARQALGERRQVRHPAHRLNFLVAGQLMRQRHDVDGTLLVEQVPHAQEDAPVRVEREVVCLELFGSLGVGRIVEQDGAEDGFFGVYIRGQAGIESEVGQGGHI